MRFRDSTFTRGKQWHALVALVLVFLILCAPLLSSAQTTGGVTFKSLVGKLLAYGKPITGLLVNLAVFLLAFGIFRYINAGADVKRRQEGAKLLLWGLISVVVMLSMWGIINIVLNTFFSSDSTSHFELSNDLWNGSSSDTNP